MYETQRDNGSGFTTGVLMGAMVGAGVALLLAPKAGAELRGDLGESMTSVRDAVTRRYRELAHRAGVELDDLEAQAHDAAESFESSAREMLENAKQRRARRGRQAQDSAFSAEV